jgi:chemotaxis protein MotB
MKNKIREEFSVWPLMIDMLSSIFIIYIVQSTILSPKAFERLEIEKKRKDFISKVSQRLQSNITNNDIGLIGEFNYLKITFSDLILFDQGDYTLKVEGKVLLSKISDLLIQKDKNDFIVSKVQVEGHTDNSSLNRSEYPKNNWELSSARALEVVDYFTTHKNCSPNLFSANAFGEYNPIKGNQKKSRRIEIKIFFSGSESSNE